MFSSDSRQSGRPVLVALRDWALPLLAVLVLAASLGWDAWQSYQRSIEQEYRLLDSHAHIADAQLSGALRVLDATLQEVAAERLASHDIKPLALSRHLAERVRKIPELRFLFLTDPAGRIEAMSDPAFIGIDASQREYFTRPRDAANATGYYVSRPYTATTGNVVIAISRPIRDARGRFLGVVAASIEPQYFKEVLETVRPEGTGHALLVSTEGDILYDTPQPDLTGKNLKGGIAFEAHIAAGKRTTRHLNAVKLTGIERLSVLRRLDYPGLIVFLSRDYDEVIATWRRNVSQRTAMFAIAAAALLYLGWLGRRRQRQLSSTRSDLRRLIDEFPLPMMVSEGASHNVIFLNRRFSEVTGYTGKDIPDVAHWYRLAYPDAEYRRRIRKEWLAHYEKAEDQGNIVPPFEVTIRCGNGEDHTFDCYLTRFSNRAVVVFVDLTVRRRLEANLRESEAQLRKAQEITRIGSWALDLPSNRLVWSDEAYRIFDIAPGTPLTYELFLSHVHPEDRDAVNQAWMAALGGAPYDFEHRIHAHGETRWVHERAELEFDRDGKPLSAVGTTHDITGHKQVELQLRLAATVFESSREGVTITDLQRNIISVNPAFCSITGYAPEEVIGKNPRLLQSGRQDAAFYRAMWDSINFKGYWSGEIWNKRKNGEVYPELLSISVVNDKHGKPTHYIGVFTDISERKRAEDEIRQLNADLEQRVRERTAELENSNRELESFSYSVSHDLRAPLRAIDGFSHVIAEEYGEPLGETGRSHLQRIRRATQKMGTLIDNLLDLAQVSRQEIRHVRTDLSRIAEEAARELDESAPGRKVEWHIQPGLSAMGDPVLLKVALDNLLRNAWKFTARVPSPRIAFGCSEADGKTVYFVRDNGAGIDMAYADKLFQPFQRLHDPKEFEGTGIGLAIVHRVIRRHGGSIRVESAPGQGATFFFTLA